MYYKPSNKLERNPIMTDTPTQYQCIGKGFCGSVWALEENRALKREDGGPGRSLQNDYDMHRRFLEASCASTIPKHPESAVAIPQVYNLIQATHNEWWEDRVARFPIDYVPCLSLLSERIPHFPIDVRNRLIDTFCPSSLRESVRSSPGDEHCLVRPYLGRRRRKAANSKFQRFSLRNYPMHVDQMELLGLNITGYARAMGAALAIMHWAAHIDANDVEFVLAPPRTTSYSVSEIFHSPFLGEHTIWVLDFDCCRAMSMGEKGVEQACTAFFRNDPFYPRPDNLSQESLVLWSAFRVAFLASSRDILRSKDFWLAELLVNRIEEVGEATRKRKEGLMGV